MQGLVQCVWGEDKVSLCVLCISWRLFTMVVSGVCLASSGQVFRASGVVASVLL